MENKIIECHEMLTSVYNQAERVFKNLKELSYKVTLNFYNNHFIKINNQYVAQKYYMPVITVQDKGDICFNLDHIEFEFYVMKNDLLFNENKEELLDLYGERINIYEFENCTVDLFQKGDDIDKLLDKIEDSNDNRFGISIDCSDILESDLIMHFNKVCELLEI